MKLDDIRSRPLVEVRIMVQHETPVELFRSYSMDDLDSGAGDWMKPGPPPWLDEPNRRWDSPTEPIVFSGKVTPDNEVFARDALDLPVT